MEAGTGVMAMLGSLVPMMRITDLLSLRKFACKQVLMSLRHFLIVRCWILWQCRAGCSQKSRSGNVDRDGCMYKVAQSEEQEDDDEEGAEC